MREKIKGLKGVEGEDKGVKGVLREKIKGFRGVEGEDKGGWGGGGV